LPHHHSLADRQKAVSDDAQGSARQRRPVKSNGLERTAAELAVIGLDPDRDVSFAEQADAVSELLQSIAHSLEFATGTVRDNDGGSERPKGTRDTVPRGVPFLI
jgi:hypothetical protein